MDQARLRWRPEYTGPEYTGPEYTGPEYTGPEYTGQENTGPEITEADRGPPMTDQSDVERDALEAMRALAGLHGRLARGVESSDERRLRELADAGGAAAGRVLAYLRERRRAGDGAEISYPERLGPWRDWCPPRGDVLGRRVRGSVRNSAVGDAGTPRHGDPGE